MARSTNHLQLRPADVLLLAALWVAPAFALRRLAHHLDPWFLLGWIAAVSVVAFFVYAGDKRAAEGGTRRTREQTLHLLALAGGWTGALLAQRMLRHKTVKGSFQFVFWLIVAGYQLLALDYALYDRLSRAVWRALT